MLENKTDCCWWGCNIKALVGKMTFEWRLGKGIKNFSWGWHQENIPGRVKSLWEGCQESLLEHDGRRGGFEVGWLCGCERKESMYVHSFAFAGICPFSSKSASLLPKTEALLRFRFLSPQQCLPTDKNQCYLYLIYTRSVRKACESIFWKKKLDLKKFFLH